jgi:hypothetical protein
VSDLDNILAVVSAAAFVVMMSTSTLPNELWLGVVTACLILNVIANIFQSRRGVPLRRSIAISAVAAGTASFVLAAGFASAHFVGPDDGYIVGHLIDREVPWWFGAVLLIAFAGVVFGFAAITGHFVSLWLFSRDRGGDCSDRPAAPS